MEKYLQIQWGNNIVFRDSLQFLFSLLDAFSGSLAKSSGQNFQHTDQVITSRYANANVEFLKRKGVFFYDSLHSFERLAETTLPLREQFFSKLSNGECKPEDYEHAQRVWKQCSGFTLGDYLSLYMLNDICILADVFETFRSNSLEEFQLDPACYMSAPQLAWSALLKFINRPLHLVTDPEMYRMI